jgi:hypothetical protein
VESAPVEVVSISRRRIPICPAAGATEGNDAVFRSPPTPPRVPEDRHGPGVDPRSGRNYRDPRCSAEWKLIGYFCLGYSIEEEDVPLLETLGWEERRTGPSFLIHR